MAQAVIITGVAAVDRALQDFEEKVQKKILRRATRASAKIVEQAALMNVPINTGRLEESIKVRAMKRSRVRQGHGVVGGGEYGGDLSGLPHYAMWLETGTKPRFTRSGKYVGRIGEWRWLRRALWDNEQRIKRTFTRAMIDGIRTIRANIALGRGATFRRR